MVTKFKDIPGYEGLYKIDTNGNVFSYKTNKILSPKLEKSGYKMINISMEKNNFKSLRIHRLVAMTFLENPMELPEVNHINGIKSDNRVNNLEWCTRVYNQRYNYNTLNYKGANTGRFGILHGKSKSVQQFSIDGILIKTWHSIMDINRTHGFSPSSIVKCCKGLGKTAYGFIWKYN